MRISDWSSDVCSSDLYARDVLAVPPAIAGVRHGCNHRVISPVQRPGVELKTIFMRRLLRIGERIVDRHFMRSEEHTSELQSLMRISYAVFCLKKKKIINKYTNIIIYTLRDKQMRK